jgi:hypothetical protein
MNPERSEWVTMTEFARMMGRTVPWAYMNAKKGYFGEFGIPVLKDETPCISKGSRIRWYFFVSSSMLQ